MTSRCFVAGPLFGYGMYIQFYMSFHLVQSAAKRNFFRAIELPSGLLQVVSEAAMAHQSLKCVALLVSIALALSSSCHAAGDNHPVATLEDQLREKAILLEIKKCFTNHPLFVAALWNETNQNPLDDSKTSYSYNETLPCGGNQDWYLIRCNNGFVSGLTLDSAVYSQHSEEMPNANELWAIGGTPGPLSGFIPWEFIVKLPYLSQISIQGSSISGAATPSDLDKLSHLSSLKIINNKVNGSIDESVTRTPLVTLDVSMNTISGPLPANMANMTRLISFSAYQNQLTGTIPSEIGKLTNLTKLDIGQNQFMGTIPASLGNLTNLKTLTLQKCQLTGEIPSDLQNMKSMSQLDLSENLLNGAFPQWISKFTNLTILALSSNQLYGTVPSNLWTPPLLTRVDIAGNYLNGIVPAPPANRNPVFAYQSNCFDSSDKSVSEQMRNSTGCSAFYKTLFPEKNETDVPIVAIIVSIVAVILLAALAVFLWRRKQKADKLEDLFGKALTQNVRGFKLNELKRATKDFSLTIGKGGYGTVYKADLKKGNVVAVKRLDQVSKQGDVEFIREVELLSRLHHRHLVNLVGFCADKGERMLIYEYMAMGSLYEHLHGPSAKEYPLSWDSRTKIAIHVALGLEYLHYGADPPLIHRDIKSANILLSDDGYSKVADFGLCKEAPLGADGSEQLVPTATAVRGSFGYLDPEYVNTSVLSEKSDVYSYGVVLLELISGHKSIHDWQPLAYWAEEYLTDREKTPLMVDPALEGSFDLDELYALCDIAHSCVQDHGAARPTIRDVAKALVENLGHALSSYAGSIADTASIMSSSQSDTSSILSSYTNSHDPSGYSYLNYSETLHWTPADSGRVASNLGVTVTSKAGRLPVPIPKRPEMKGSDSQV